jgi:hypothetical protein
MPTQPERDSIKSRDAANVHRRLQPSTLRLRRLLLRTLSRRRHHPRPPKQRMEARPLHQNSSPRRPQRLRRLWLQQPKRANHRGHHNGPARTLPLRQTALLRSAVPAVPGRFVQQHLLATPDTLWRLHHQLSHLLHGQRDERHGYSNVQAHLQRRRPDARRDGGIHRAVERFAS